jgi:ribosome recycling factor
MFFSKQSYFFSNQHLNKSTNQPFLLHFLNISTPQLFNSSTFFLYLQPNQHNNKMSEELDFVFDEAEERMGNAIVHLERELGKLRAGKANPQMLDSVRVDYYGTLTSLSQVSNINTPDPRSIVIQPWEKNMLAPIEKAIMAANLGFNPQNDGTLIRVLVPPLTEERRRDLVKKAKTEAEATKVSIRNIRRDGIDAGKKLEKEGLPEDLVKKFESNIQDLTNKYIGRVDKLIEIKESDIMTI